LIKKGFWLLAMQMKKRSAKPGLKTLNINNR
jgi:hypothetical protein